MYVSPLLSCETVQACLISACRSAKSSVKITATAAKITMASPEAMPEEGMTPAVSRSRERESCGCAVALSSREMLRGCDGTSHMATHLFGGTFVQSTDRDTFAPSLTRIVQVRTRMDLVRTIAVPSQPVSAIPAGGATLCNMLSETCMSHRLISTR